MSLIAPERKLDREIIIEQLVESPSVFVCHNFLSAEECAHLITQAKDKMAPSTTVDPVTGEFIVIKDRTSTVTFFSIYQDEVITRVEDRIAELTQYPVVNGEGLQVLRYKIGQEYKPHYDFFDPAHKGSSVPLAKGGQRVYTVLMYLCDVEEGGETILPKLNLAVKPRMGDALLFYNLDQYGKPHFDTLHGSIPVVQGEKWVSTKLVREREYR